MSPITVTVKLPGMMNGATITTTGDFAVIQVVGIDSASDMRKIARAAADTGAVKGTVFTGKIVNPSLLSKYERLAARSRPEFRRRVTKIGPDRFRLDYDRLPSVK